MHWYHDRFTEPSSRSIYNGFRTAHRPAEMRELLADPELAISLKFTAILAAFAYLQFPVRFSAFRQLIPDDFWKEHVSCGYNPYRGNVPVYTEEGERHFAMCIGPHTSFYGLHVVWLVTSALICAGCDPRGTLFEPPSDMAITRYTLGHPFFKCELHEPDGIHLFRS